jgi:hypothetical protein
MERSDLLPGVSPDPCPPAVVADTRSEIRRARLRATLRDIAQITLLAGIDYFFFNWPLTHIPFVSRSTSALVVALLNATILTHVIMVRTFPKLAAKRIAGTWCLAERARFFQTTRQQ